MSDDTTVCRVCRRPALWFGWRVRGNYIERCPFVLCPQSGLDEPHTIRIGLGRADGVLVEQYPDGSTRELCGAER